MAQKFMTNQDMLPQDLHIHTTFSTGDKAVVKEQTVDFISRFRHANIIGISDHTEFIVDDFEEYKKAVYSQNLHLGTEVDGFDWVDTASNMDVEYYLYHCRDKSWEYRGAEKLLQTGKPVIISHPLIMNTDLNKVPSECLVEINNRYVWRSDWRKGYSDHVSRFRFVISSDAHQPYFLNQHIARRVAEELGIRETLLFPRVAENRLPEVG